MNHRIRELAEQAWDSLIDEVGDFVSEDGKVNWDFLHAYDKKFAELLVRDCARVVDELNEAYGAPSTAGEFIRRYYEIDV
jgi:hypothetical protein